MQTNNWTSCSYQVVLFNMCSYDSLYNVVMQTVDNHAQPGGINFYFSLLFCGGGASNTIL